MPGRNASAIGQMLLNAVDVRQNGNTDFAAITDTSKFPGAILFGGFSNVGLDKETNLFLTGADLPADCNSSNGSCLRSPPVCTGYLYGGSGCSKASLTSFMQTYGIQYYGCHGTGWDCAGITTDDPIIVGTLMGFSVPNMVNDPVVIMDSCLNSEIPGTYLYSNLLSHYYLKFPTVATLAQKMESSPGGASVYIGFTLETNFWSIPYISLMYTNFKNSENLYGPNSDTIGQAFLQAKLGMDASSIGLVKDEGAAMQLYGDPTLKYSEIGSERDDG